MENGAITAGLSSATVSTAGAATGETAASKKPRGERPRAGCDNGAIPGVPGDAGTFVPELIERVMKLLTDFVGQLLSLFFRAPESGGNCGSPPPGTGTEPGKGAGGEPGVVEPGPATPEGAQASDLQAAVDDTGKVSVLTDDGYTICCTGKQEEWTITGPDGKVTRIWGDPHVQESDNDRWDFFERSSFVFGENKITVETVPIADGVSVTGRITIYNGSERVTISDIDKNQPKLTSVSDDARVHDASLDDGTVYKLSLEDNGQEEQWVRDEGSISH